MPSETLAEYVTRVMRDRRLSSYDVERAARGRIKQPTIYRIAAGEILEPRTASLQSLALGLGVVEEELFTIARGKPLKGDTLAHERLAAIDVKYRELSPKQRQHLDYLIQVLEREVNRLVSNS